MNAAATATRAPLGSAYVTGRGDSGRAAQPRDLDRETIAVTLPTHQADPADEPEATGRNNAIGRAPVVSDALLRALAEVKGQAQFLLYLADQIEDSLDQLAHEDDVCQGSFLCKVLGMYSAQLESKHQGLGDRISETCQEVYVTVREFDTTA
jgi:hypothetical protein